MKKTVMCVLVWGAGLARGEMAVLMMKKVASFCVPKAWPAHGKHAASAWQASGKQAPFYGKLRFGPWLTVCAFHILGVTALRPSTPYIILKGANDEKSRLLLCAKRMASSWQACGKRVAG
jgi:hypothetical protein